MPSTIIHKKCPQCNKIALVASERKIGTVIKLVTYSCGHIVTEKIVQEYDAYANIVSQSGHTPYPFQIEGAKFIERSGFRAGVLDEMGLGKTIQSLIVIKAHPKELTPYMILCKSGLRIQWMKMCIDWLGDDMMPQVIDGTNDYYMPGVPGYIVSLDLLRRVKNKNKSRAKAIKDNFDAVLDMEMTAEEAEAAKEDELQKLVKRLGINYVVIDECQLIKNNDSQRTGAVRSICKETEHIVLLSGTPIKNNALEYFPALNILAPQKFPRQSGYAYQWVSTYWDGYKYKIGGLKDPQRFFDYTKDLLIRRTRAEVMPQLPTVTRDFKFFEMGSEVEEMYKAKYKQFQDEYNSTGGGSSFSSYSNLLAYISEMRHITGMAKIEPCMDFLQEFMLDTDRKIVIFVHHIDVAIALQIKIQRDILDAGGYEYKVEYLAGGMDPNKADELKSRFLDGPNRILIASTLASGEGHNLQKAADCIMLERQWNPANEEQAECRFIRIGQLANKVNAAYLIAVGTVDEFFTKLVEQKRMVMRQTLDGTEGSWEESSIMRELMDVLAMNGGKKWGW